MAADILAALAGPAPKKGEASAAMPEQSEDTGSDHAAQEILDAIQAGDASALAEALRAFIQMV